MRMPSKMNLHYGGAWHTPIGGYAPTVNPATGAILAEAPVADAMDVDQCVRAAADAFPVWRRSAPESRGSALRQIANVIRKNIADLALLDAANNGNPVAIIGRNLEYAANLVDYFAALALEAKGSTFPGTPDALRFSVREPIGVCARLVAYNHPAMFLAAKLAPAIAAGNCVVMKAPDQAPLSSLLLMELIEGMTLEERFQGPRLSAGEARRIGAAVARSLSEYSSGKHAKSLASAARRFCGVAIRTSEAGGIWPIQTVGLLGGGIPAPPSVSVLQRSVETEKVVGHA